MGLLIPETKANAWATSSPSRYGDPCFASLNYRYNLGIKTNPTQYMDRGTITEEMTIAKKTGKDPHVAGERKLQELMDELPQRSENLEWYKSQWSRWLAGVETYDTDYNLWAVEPFQRKVNLKIEGTSPNIIGYIDVLIERDGKPVIADIKSKGQLSWGIEQNWRRQLTVYCLAIMKEMKLDYIPEAEIHMISVGKTPGSRVIPVEITADDISELIDKAKVLQYSIDNDYWPRNTNASKCSDHGCGFYGRCWSDHLIPINESLQKFS